MVRIVSVAIPHDQPGTLRLQSQALAFFSVVDLLLLVLVRPGSAVVSGHAPVDGDLSGTADLRAPFPGCQLSFRVQSEKLVAPEAVATGGGDLYVKTEKILSHNKIPRSNGEAANQECITFSGGWRPWVSRQKLLPRFFTSPQ